MVAKSDISRIEFNEIEQGKKYATEVGKILKSKLGKMMIKSQPFTVEGVVQDNFEYTLVFTTKDMTSDDIPSTLTEHTLSYTTGVEDTVDTVLQGLSDSLTTETSEVASISLCLDATDDDDKFLFILGKDGIVTEAISDTGINRELEKIYTESEVPACYLGYGKHPTSSLPRVVITPLPSSTVCNVMEDSIMEVDGVLKEYTSSYINYSMTLTCEAGSTDEVLRSGNSAQSILNHLKKSMTNEIIRKTVQNNLDSVCYPIMNINPLPIMEYTGYQDMSTCVADFSCVDVYYPEVSSGIYETIKATGTLEDEPSDEEPTEDSTPLDQSVEVDLTQPTHS